VSLLPVMGWVPFAFQAISTVADRYSYLALVGVGLSTGCILQRFAKEGQMAVIGMVVIGLLATRNAQQVQVWRDTESLLTHALQVNPHSIMAHNNLGLVRAQQGQLAAAIAQYQRALQSNPQAAEVHYNLGNAWLRQGNQEQALTHYRRAVQLKPTWAEAHNNLGTTLEELGHVPEAILHYQTAIQRQPQLASAYNNLGDAFLKQGHVTAAVNQFRTATRLQPTWTEAHYNLAIALTKLGQEQDAIAAYRAAVAARPHWLRAMLPLAWLLTTQQPPSLQAATEAIAIATQASRIPGPHQAVALYTLSRAQRITDNTAAALFTAQQAFAFAKAAGDTELAGKIAADFPTLRDEE
jgi:tetratricopeptide (TPR) repeat protein